MEYEVIDVSKHNGKITNTAINDFKGSGITAAILRIGYRGYGSSGTITLDSQFLNNAKIFTENKIMIGCYFLSQAITLTEAKEEANWIITTLKKHNINLTLPIFIDSEWSNNAHNGRADGLNKEDRTNISITFINEIIRAGYKAGIYASTSWFNDKLIDSKLSSYDHWVADYRSSCGYNKAKVGWQFTSNKVFPNINGKFDISIFYKSYKETNKPVSVPNANKTSNKKISSAQKFGKTYSRYYITTGNVNMRYTPNVLTSDNVITVIPKGSLVRCWGYYTPINNTNWYLVVYGKHTGYVSGKYLKKK